MIYLLSLSFKNTHRCKSAKVNIIGGYAHNKKGFYEFVVVVLSVNLLNSLADQVNVNTQEEFYKNPITFRIYI